jgi:hypothetical protein
MRGGHWRKSANHGQESYEEGSIRIFRIRKKLLNKLLKHSSFSRNNDGMERLDQGHSILNYWSRNWHFSAGNQTRASAVIGEHSSKVIFKQHVNSYLEYLHKRHCTRYMNIHKHTWTALGCRPNSTCKLFNPEYWHQALASPCIHYQARQITPGPPHRETWPRSSPAKP